MKRFLVALLLTAPVLAATSQPAARYFQQQVNYWIKVQLNDQQNSLDGFEKIEYTNHSKDTLTYVWFHLWMNAYKNDKTAFSEQLLRNGRTDFYFAADSMKGYINRLDFKVNNITATTESTEDIDMIKVVLPHPLAPGSTTTITTPFHVQLPYNFSRGGHVLQSYQVTQWYPKPAVYDNRGWHPIPYLDQGEFYSEFGNFDVQITLPDNYIVAATGQLQDAKELARLQALGKTTATQQENYLRFIQQYESAIKKKVVPKHMESFAPASSATLKTVHYTQENVHDFAWFTSKQFIVQYDSIQLPSHAVAVYSFYNPWQQPNWKNSVAYAKDGLRYYSKCIGDYPYHTASVVGGDNNVNSGGMEYPTITLITTQDGDKDLDETIAHELGHNWFYGALASNERDHAWMDEGMNTFYENRYVYEKYTATAAADKNSFLNNMIPEDNALEAVFLHSVEKLHKDQPIDQTSDAFSENNYALMVYIKASIWMKALEQQLGRERFEKSMHQYYAEWQNKHPYPEDFKKSIETSSGQSIDSLYHQLFVTASENKVTAPQKQIKLVPFFSLKNTDRYHYVSISPLAGANAYDKLMIGGVIHNYQLPLNRFNFLVAPLYATGTHKLNLFGRASFNTFTTKSWLEVSGSIAKYTMNEYDPGNAPVLYPTVTRIVPSVKYILYNKDLRSTEKWTFQLKSFLLREEQLQFNTVITPIDTFNTVGTTPVNSYVNQLAITWSNTRVLYPYHFNITVDQGKDFIRAGFTGKYFFNYTSGKEGIEARFFAGKFLYLGSKTFIRQYETDRYQLNLTGPKGDEDYTYSDYFIGRNKFSGWQSQQIMERDGFFKVRTDLYSSKIGKTDDWLMAFNLDGNIPDKYNPLQVLPFRIPLMFFLDVGTYAEAWNDNNASGRFLYDAGLQLPLFKKLVNIYFPILSSKVYRDYNKSVLGPKFFWKTVSFNIDLQQLQLSKLSRSIPL